MWRKPPLHECRKCTGRQSTPCAPSSIAASSRSVFPGRDEYQETSPIVTRFSYEEFDLSDVKTYPLDARRNKASAADFARSLGSLGSIGAFIDALPNILAAADFKAVIRALIDARKAESGIVWGLGAHVIKTGLGP